MKKYSLSHKGLGYKIGYFFVAIHIMKWNKIDKNEDLKKSRIFSIF